MAPFGTAGTDEGVELSSMKRMTFLARRTSFMTAFSDAFFELAAVLGAGDHHGEGRGRRCGFSEEDLGHIVVNDPLGETLDDGGLADAGLAEEDGVVLGATAEDLHDAFDFIGTADHRIEVPSRASSVRSRPNESRAGVLDLVLPSPLDSPAFVPSDSTPAPKRLRTSSRTSSSFSPRFMRTCAATPSFSRRRPSKRCSVPT